MGCASDINLFATIDMANMIKQLKLDARPFMLVHDSIVAEVKEEHVKEYCRVLKEVTQKNRGVSIPNFPIGVDQEVHEDYSFGKFEEIYGKEYKQYNPTSISNSG